MRAEPELCVVVLSYCNESTILAAVGSLMAQAEPLEIVVSHSGGGTTPELLERFRPSLRVLIGAERRLPGAARNVGVAATRAPYVAFLAGDCRALAGWAAGRLTRHRAGAVAVAGAMAPLDRRPASLAAHLLQHSSRMPHLKMPPPFRHGASYQRAVLERLGPFSEDLPAGEDTAFNARLRAAGMEIVWAPDVVTAHAYPTAVPALLADRFHRGRQRAFRRTTALRTLLAGKALLEAPAALWRAARPGSPMLPREVLRAAPLVAAGALATAAGVAHGGLNRGRSAPPDRPADDP